MLTDNGTLTLGTISANDGTHFTVEKAFGVKVVGSDNSESTYPSVDQGGSTGGSDNGSNGSDNGSGGSDSGNNGGGSTGGSTGGSNGGTSTTSRPITIQSSFGGKVIASAAEAIPGKVITLTATPNSGYILQSLKVTTASGKAVFLTRQSGSKYTFTMPASAVTVSAVFQAEATQPQQMPFSDVPAGSWYYDAVQYVYEESLMGGTGNDRFSPDLTTSRGMIVTILYRLEGSPAVSGGATFADISSGQWYSDGVAWASANGIVTGYSNGSFGPNDTITREQMAAILYRYARYKGYDVSARAQLSSYSDASQVASYATESMSWAVGSGLITGTSGTTLSPAGSATRAQAAVILARFCQNLAD